VLGRSLSKLSVIFGRIVDTQREDSTGLTDMERRTVLNVR